MDLPLLLSNNFLTSIPNFTPKGLQLMSDNDVNQSIECIELFKTKVNNTDVSNISDDLVLVQKYTLKVCETFICALRLRKGSGNNLEICQDVATIISNTIEIFQEIWKLIRKDKKAISHANDILQDMESEVVNEKPSNENSSFFNKAKAYENPSNENSSCFGKAKTHENPSNENSSCFGKAKTHENPSNENSSCFGKAKTHENPSNENSSCFGKAKTHENPSNENSSFFGKAKAHENPSNENSSCFGKAKTHENPSNENSSFFGKAKAYFALFDSSKIYVIVGIALVLGLIVLKIRR
ncbi:uncharacterized protein LOC136077026 [Hydra vulgaris]|uniref:Uncharacterized protein LOC136077026 n=1 Tax=Hydra vulgaris TaxID=6087 RepID=A0ABM4BEL6_HYDVU